MRLGNLHSRALADAIRPLAAAAAATRGTTCKTAPTMSRTATNARMTGRVDPTRASRYVLATGYVVPTCIVLLSAFGDSGTPQAAAPCAG